MKHLIVLLLLIPSLLFSHHGQLEYSGQWQDSLSSVESLPDFYMEIEIYNPTNKAVTGDDYLWRVVDCKNGKNRIYKGSINSGAKEYSDGEFTIIISKSFVPCQIEPFHD